MITYMYVSVLLLQIRTSVSILKLYYLRFPKMVILLYTEGKIMKMENTLNKKLTHLSLW